MTPSQPDPSLPLREVLACEIRHEDKLAVAFVLREGLSFRLLDYANGDEAAIVRDSRTLRQLEWVFQLPVRVLDGGDAAFLGMKTLLAEQEGREIYQLKVPKPPLVLA